MTEAVRTDPNLPARSLFRHADFRRLWVGDSISQLGTQLSGLALPLLAVTTLHASAGEMGLLAAAQTIAFLVIGLPAGAWVDRSRTRRVLVINDLIRAVAFGSVPAAWWAGLLTLTQLYLVALTVGVCTVFFDVAYQSYLPALVTADRMVDGNATLQASESVARVGGPAVGGALLRVTAPATLLGLDALSFLVSALFVARIRRPDPPCDRAGRRRLSVEIREGLAFVVREPLLRRITAGTASCNLFNGVQKAVDVLVMVRVLGLDGGQIGSAFAVGAVGGVIGALTAGRAAAWIGEGRIIPWSMVLTASAGFALPLAALLRGAVPVLLVICVGDFLFSWAVVVYNITQVSFRQRLCPPELLGRMNASVRFLVWGTLPIGGLLGGLLGGLVGLTATLWLAAAGGVTAALPVLLSPLLTMRRLPTATAHG